MILLSILLVLLIAGLPLALSLWQRRHIMRLTEANLQAEDLSVAAFYQHQLEGLERDHATGILSPGQYQLARAELQRHVLNTGPLPPPLSAEKSGLTWMLAVFGLLLIPCLGLFLYALAGQPFYEPQPASQRALAAFSMPRLNQLSQEVQTLTPKDPDYAPQHVRLGELEARNGLDQQAIADWKLALNAHFTPELALQIAELETRDAGHVTEHALTLYQRALEAAPADAPWHLAVEERIATGEHEKDEANPPSNAPSSGDTP